MVDNATGACATRSLAKDEARGRDCPRIGTRIVIEPCDDLIKPVAEPFGRMPISDATDWKTALGVCSTIRPRPEV